jgi:hypothetical protein
VGVSRFKGKEYVKGYVRDLLYDGRTGRDVSASIFANTMSRFYTVCDDVQACALTGEQTQKLIEEKRKECAYGLCLIASDRRVLRHYQGLEGLGCDLFYPSTRNLTNMLIVSPAADADLSGFRDIIFLDKPMDYHLPSIVGKNVYVNTEIDGQKMLGTIDVKRERLIEVYNALRRDWHLLNGNNAEEVVKSCSALGFDVNEFIFALNVFEELGLVSYGDGKLIVYRGVKAELTDSKLYRAALTLHGEC